MASILAIAFAAASPLWASEPDIGQVVRRWLVAILSSGKVSDPPGNVATAGEAFGARLLAAGSEAAAAGAAGSLSNILARAGSLTNAAAVPVAYIASDVPLGTGDGSTNLNFGAYAVASRSSSPSNLSVSVWFPVRTSSAPSLKWRVSTKAGSVYAEEVTNSWPETSDEGGYPCVTYLLALPPAARGIPLRPRLELALGGPEAGDCLALSSLGISVTPAGGSERLPYTGTDTYSLGGEELRVTYAGGIAVGASWRGTNYFGKGEVRP